MSNVTPETSVIDPLIGQIYDQLEEPNWAPWLRFGPDTLQTQARVYPEGQMTICDETGGPVIALSANRVNWDGDPEHLTSWDAVAGEDESYADTYEATGNTYVLMSMSVKKDIKGSGASGQIIDMVQEYASKEGIEHIIGDFRPSNFADYKRQTGKFNFEEYIALKREDGLPQDGWLRTVTRRDMNVLQPNARAMVINTSLEELQTYTESYKPEAWWKVTDPEQIQYLLEWHQPGTELESVDEVWECGETGTWYVDNANSKAVYIESNVWGELPVAPNKAENSNPDAGNETGEAFVSRYDLSEEEMKQLENELVSIFKDTKPDDGIYGVWIGTTNKYSNLIRSLEARTPEFNGIETIVTPSAEARSKFFALIDTRSDSNRVIHATRISGSVFDESFGIDDNSESTGFIAINELVESDQNFTRDDFINYYSSVGINLDNCIGVETNFTVGEKTDTGIEGIRVSDLGYLSLFNLIERKDLGTGNSGVFAFVNIKTERSLAAIGITSQPLVGRPDLLVPDIDGSFTDKFKPVMIPVDEECIRIMKSLQPFTVDEIELA